MHSLNIPEHAHFQTLDDLLTRHTEPQREYHNLAHVYNLLELLSTAPASPTLELAVWFHDAVYDPTRADNEAQSAVLAQQKLALLGIGASTLERITQLILATKTHHADDEEMQRFIEADLSILAAPEKTYAAYAKAIRKEYAWIPDEVFKPGRARILQSFLARATLFQTPQFKGLEVKARANLEGELEGLLASV